MDLSLKKIKIVCFFLLFISFRAAAPVWDSLSIALPVPVEPYKNLKFVIGLVETLGDTLAFNPLEEAYGIYQIRPVRLNDYNFRTRNRYSRKDLFTYEVSEKIFLYYADQIGPYKFEKIARNWNGSGRKTDFYWERVRGYLAQGTEKAQGTERRAQ
jgi:hypothetical protein